MMPLVEVHLTILNESRFSRLIELFTRKLMFSFASLEGLALVRRMENPMKTLNPLKALKISNMLFLMKFICLQLLNLITGLMSLRPYRISAFTATKGERNAITEMFVGSNVINASLVKKLEAYASRVSEQNSMKHELMNLQMQHWNDTWRTLVNERFVHHAIMTTVRFKEPY